jgi:hypothetical protein
MGSGGGGVKRKVIIEVEIDDSLETACSEKCLYYSYGKYYCQLFQANLEYRTVF